MWTDSFQILKPRVGKLLLLLLLSAAGLLPIPAPAQWEGISISPQYKFRKILFIGDCGWLAAEETYKEGILLYTDNGGDNWREIARFRGSIKDLYFINVQEGWVVVRGELWHSQDGGKTWAELPIEINTEGVPWIPPRGPGVLSKIHFFDSNNGIAVFQTRYIVYADVIVATTQDGGRRWQTRKWAYSVVDSWEITGARISIPQYGEMWLSSDRGVSWEVRPAPMFDYPRFIDPTTGRQFISQIPRYGYVREKLFVSAIEGWMLLFLFRLDRMHHAELWHTQDGGIQWLRIPWPVDIDPRSRESWPRGLPAEFEAHLALNSSRGDLWVTFYDFEHPLLRGRNVHVVSVHALDKFPTTWGHLKRMP